MATRSLIFTGSSRRQALLSLCIVAAALSTIPSVVPVQMLSINSLPAAFGQEFGGQGIQAPPVNSTFGNSTNSLNNNTISSMIADAVAKAKANNTSTAESNNTSGGIVIPGAIILRGLVSSMIPPGIAGSNSINSSNYNNGTIENNVTSNSIYAGSNSNNNNAQIMGGKWRLYINDGDIRSLHANFTIAHTDGTDYHRVVIEDSSSDVDGAQAFYTDNGTSASMSVKGDISVDGKLMWRNVPIKIMASSQVISMSIQDGGMAEQYFSSYPIYGFIDSIEPHVS